MKQNSHLCFIRFLLFDLLLLLLLISSTSARPLLAKQVEGEVKANELTKAAASSTETKEEFSDLMGSEECDVKDEGCLQRRMIADAHLDYIYTQHNKP